MNIRAAPSDWLSYALGALLVAAIVHLVSILALPKLASNDAYARIERISALNQVSLLPRAAGSRQIIPFYDPAVAMGVCRYDLAEGSLRLKISVTNDSLLSISFHDRYGRIYYAMTDRAAVRGAIDAVIVTQKQIEALEAKDSPDEPPQDLRLVTLQEKGFVLFRALAEQEGDYASARQMIAAASCKPDSP